MCSNTCVARPKIKREKVGFHASIFSHQSSLKMLESCHLEYKQIIPKVLFNTHFNFHIFFLPSPLSVVIVSSIVSKFRSHWDGLAVFLSSCTLLYKPFLFLNMPKTVRACTRTHTHTHVLAASQLLPSNFL